MSHKWRELTINGAEGSHWKQDTTALGLKFASVRK